MNMKLRIASVVCTWEQVGYIDATSNLEIPLLMQDQKVNNETVNQEQSLTLVRNLIRVTISQIAYTRNIFPSQCCEKCKQF